MKEKSPLFIVLALATLAIAVGAYFAVLWWVPVMGEDTSPPATETSEDQATGQIPRFTAYGTITKIDSKNISISVSDDGAANAFSFVYNANTEFYSFGYKDNDDLEGTKTPIKPSDLKAGDTVAVYTDEKIGSVSSQTLLQVLKLK